MDADKQERLEIAGWTVSDYEKFLGLTKEKVDEVKRRTFEHLNKNIKIETSDEYTIAWINTTKQPDKKIARNFYDYSRFGGETEITFLQLYTYEYHTEWNIYTVDVWEVINVKSHCKAQLKLMIDGMKCVEEFLE